MAQRLVAEHRIYHPAQGKITRKPDDCRSSAPILLVNIIATSLS